MITKLRPDAAHAGLPPVDLQQASAEFGVELTAAQCNTLLAFGRLLQHWNRVHNLTAIETAPDIVVLHLLDSLAIVPEIDAICAERASILDVGSGGGLPGVPLAVARPAWHVTLLDKVAKKVAFLTQARLDFGLSNVDCVHARVERWSSPRPFDVIVSRAFASLSEFVALTSHLIAPAGRWCAMKGALPEAELRDLREASPELTVRTVKLRVPRLAAERHLIVMHR